LVWPDALCDFIFVGIDNIPLNVTFGFSVVNREQHCFKQLAITYLLFNFFVKRKNYNLNNINGETAWVIIFVSAVSCFLTTFTRLLETFFILGMFLLDTVGRTI